jgi:hypothetical protein
MTTLSRRGPVLAACTTIVATLVTGTLVADVPDAGVIHGCYKKSSGGLRVIDASTGDTCAAGELALTWNEVGPQGLTGATGAPGPQGPAGPAPSSGWVGRWVYSTGAGDTTRINTLLFVYNPGDPADPTAPYAHVTVKFRKDGCTADRELFADSGSFTAPGDMAMLPLVPAPDKTAGIGCTIVTSDVPIFVSARIQHEYSACAVEIGCISKLSHEDPAFFPVSWK